MTVTTGFADGVLTITGDGYAGLSGGTLSTAGDINGDGYDDIIIGAPGANSKKGESYVLFGGDFTGDSTVTSASGDDSVSLSASRTDLISEPRDNPRTSGDDTNYSAFSNTYICAGSFTPTVTNQGDGSDMVPVDSYTDLLNEEEDHHKV